MGPGSQILCRKLYKKHNGTVLSCGRRNAVIQEVLNSDIQLGDVQRRLRLNTSSCNSGGMIVGTACGLREKNSSSRLRDNTSADTFCASGKCRAVICISRTAIMNANILRRCDRVGSLAEPLFNVMTTTMLLQRHWTCFPSHCGPHSVVATTI